MRNLIPHITMFILISIITVAGLKACDYESEQNNAKNMQWIQDAKENKPFTNYGE